MNQSIHLFTRVSSLTESRSYCVYYIYSDLYQSLIVFCYTGRALESFIFISIDLYTYAYRYIDIPIYQYINIYIYIYGHLLNIDMMMSVSSVFHWSVLLCNRCVPDDDRSIDRLID